MRCIFMSKTNKNILKRVLSKIGNLFKQSEKNSSLEENRKYEEAERSSTITPLKNSKSEDKVFPEKYNKSEDFARDKVNDETKNNTQEYLNVVESQMIDSSDSVPENNTNNLEIHNIVKQDELLNFEVENISPSKNKQESTQVNSSHKDISETHTLIDPKEYLELEYKIIENRKAKTKPVQKNTKDTLPEDKKPLDFKLVNQAKEPLENKETEIKPIKEKLIVKVDTNKDHKNDEGKEERKQSEVMPIIEEEKNKSLKDQKKIVKGEKVRTKEQTVIRMTSDLKTDTISFNKDTESEDSLERNMEFEETELLTESSKKSHDLERDSEVTSSLEKEDTKLQVEENSIIKESSENLIDGSLPGKDIGSENGFGSETEQVDFPLESSSETLDSLERNSKDEIDAMSLNEGIDVEGNFEMDFKEVEFLSEYSDDGEYENIVNYKETLHQYEQQIENRDDDDYDDFDLDDLFSDDKFQKELSEVTYSNTNDYTENTQVIQKYQEDPTNQQIFSDIVEKNQPLVKKVVQRYLGAAANTSMTYDDLVSAGNIGMFKAIEKFDPSSGFQFSTYATHWIAQGITRTIANEGRMIRVPVHQVDNILKLTKIENKMVQDHAVIDDNRIMTEMEINRKKLDEIRYVRDTYKVVPSMDVPIGDGEGSTLGQFITPDQLVYSGHQTYLESPSDRVENEVFSEELIEWMTTKLTEQELDIVIRRNGLHGKEPEILEAIGIDYGVTRERIRQIEARAYRKLRRTIKSFIKID